MKMKLIPLAALAAFMLPTAGFSLGIRIVDQDPFATSRGDAFTATADNPSAIYYNPAGITQLEGQNLSLGFYGIYLQDKYTGANGDAWRSKDKFQAVPQIYYTYSIKDTPISLGLGVYAPYGFGIQWPDNNPFRTQGLRGQVEYLTVNPVIAWKVNSVFSIAAGVTINYANADLEQGVAPFPGNAFKFNGSGYAAGFNIGLLYQPAREHSFGLSYHSQTLANLVGHSILAAPGFSPYIVDNSNARFQFPQFMSAGYSYRPTPDWNFEFDIDWTDWHQLKTVTLNQPFLGPSNVHFNWLSSFMFELGGTRYFSNGYHVSAGYIFSGNSTPGDSNFSPLVPDSNRHILSAGIGKKWGPYSCDFAYQFAYGPPRSINNGTVADGEYRFISHAVTLSFGYHF
jgi:long-chain fatty acid transport protein